MNLIKVMSYGSEKHLNTDSICCIEPSGHQTLVIIGGSYNFYVDVKYEDFIAMLEDIYRPKPEPLVTKEPARLLADTALEAATQPHMAMPAIDSVGNVALAAIQSGYTLKLDLKPEGSLKHEPNQVQQGTNPQPR